MKVSSPNIKPVSEAVAKDEHIRVLHVDDEVSLLKVAKQILELQGLFQVDSAGSVEEAFEKMKQKDYDVIVSDYQMPIKDGLQFLKELKENANNIPFILFTGKGREEVAIEALNLGADRYFSKTGKPETVYGELTHAIKQIIMRKKVENDLIENEEKFRLYIENSPVAVFVANPNAEYEYVNQAASRILGYSAKELLEMSIPQVSFVADSIQDLDRFSELKKKGKIIQETILKHKNGNPVYVNLNAVKLSNGKLIAFCENITERKKAEKELERIFDLSPDMVCVCTTEGGLLKVSPSCEKILGYTQEELLKIGWSKLVHPDDVEPTNKEVEKQLKGSFVANFVNRYRHKDGSYVSLEWQASFAEKGIVHATARDITERKKMEEKILQQNEFLNSALEALTHPFYVIDADDYTIQLANTASGFGTSKKLICYEVTHKQNKPCSNEHPCPLEKVKKTKKPVVIEHIHIDKNGNRRIVEVHGYPIFDNDGNIVQMIEYCLDITERKKAEIMLRNSEQKYKNLFESTHEGIVISGPDGKISSVNQAFATMLGYEFPEELLGVPAVELYVDSNARKAIFKKMEKKGYVKNYTMQFKKKDGFPIHVECTALIRRDEEGNIIQAEAFIRDIHEREIALEALDRTLEDLSLVNEKLGVVGGLTRHDVRNKLSAVTGNIYLAKQALPTDSESVKYLNETEHAINQIEEIFDSAKTYEQLGIEELTYLDVGESFERATSLLADLRGIEMVNDCGNVKVLADSLLDTLFYNLMDNSLKHGEKISKIRIYCKTGKDRLKLVYEDNGIGIPEAEKEKIFGEGYGKGTGVGLHMIKILCNIYGWTIQETGKQGKGAQFTITVPNKTQNKK